MLHLLAEKLLKAVAEGKVGGPHHHEVIKVVRVDPPTGLLKHVAASDHDMIVQDGELGPLPGHHGRQGVELFQHE